MNPLTELKPKTPGLLLVLAPALVALTALILVPPLFGEGTQHREQPPDGTVPGYFGRMFHLPRFASPKQHICASNGVKSVNAFRERD